MPTVRIAYYSDILCVWAYLGQRRIDQLAEAFGGQVSIEMHFCSVFPDAWGKIEAGWSDRGGFGGFGEHVNTVAQRYPHIEVTPKLWRDVRPRSSVSAHLFIKAVELIETSGDGRARPYLERLSTQTAWAIRKAFFADGRDISDWEVLAGILSEIGVDRGAVEHAIRSSEAVARLVADAEMSRKNGVAVSPTLIMNEGRQKLNGNVGYRLIEANVQELLRRPDENEASWC